MPPDPLLDCRHPRPESIPANLVTKSVIGSLKIYKSFHSASSHIGLEKKAAITYYRS